ncbi:MAG: TolC family protein [Bacteroidota bacterium]
MFKYLACAICACVFSINAIAQSGGVQSILNQIEQNNTSLLAYRSLIEGQSRGLEVTNALQPAQLIGYYLPFGEHTTADYYEIEIAQSFDFPSVYTARKELIGLQQAQLATAYDQKRQEVLLPAKQLCIGLIYLNKKYEVISDRVEKAQQVMEQTQQLFDDEQLGIIELNKAKVGWLQIKYSLDQLESEQAILRTRLEKLNGGQAVNLQETEYPDKTEVFNFESLWMEYSVADPSLKMLAQKEQVAAQQLMVTKRSNLPGITAGYNAQGFQGEYYSGFLAGLSFPIWKSNAKVNAAKALTDYRQQATTSGLQEARSHLLELYQRYGQLQDGLAEYRSTLGGLGNEEFLREAYELGELSFIQYYQEAQFYWQAYDDMLLMERDLYQLLAELTKHKL